LRIPALFACLFPLIVALWHEGVASSSSAVDGDSELELRASLSGYSLLEPEARCCAFSLQIVPSGKGSLILQVAAGRRVVQLHLLPTQLMELKRSLRNASFFTLPSEVGERSFDGDERIVEVRLGPRTHRVRLLGGRADPKDTAASARELDANRRAWSVWTAIRGLFEDPEATVQ
jgi:hypothetical protein